MSNSFSRTWQGYYATRIYAPLSGAARKLRETSRKIRGKSKPSVTPCLPVISWRQCTARRSFSLVETDKANGNVRINELALLSGLASECRDGSNIFEIGTFDGRSTLNMALSAPPNCQIHTLDLPPDAETRFELAVGERHMVDKAESGARYRKYQNSHPGPVGRIHQLMGDSASFDFTPYEKTCSLVFVDGSHHYDYVMSDSHNALKLIEPGGVIVWHDYGVWDDVTRGLDELERDCGLGIKHVRGTSLAVCRMAHGLSSDK